MTRFSRLALALSAPALLLAMAPGCDVGDPGGGVTPCEVGVGDLVITEVLSNPTGPDSGLEWFEIYNASAEEVELRTLRVELTRGDSTKRHTIAFPTPITIAPGGYATLASGPTDLGFAASYIFGSTLGDLPNSGGVFRLTCSDGDVIDESCYGDACDPEAAVAAEGMTWALVAPGAPDYLVNDGRNGWRESVPTPNQANPEVPIVVPSDCSVFPGELAITEIGSDPTGADTGMEWIEVYNTSAKALDLRAVELVMEAGTATKAHTIIGDTAVLVASGAYAVIATGPEANVGASYVWDDLGSIPNKGALFTLRCLEGAVIDTACFGEGCDPIGPTPGSGQSIAFTAPSGPAADTNDGPAGWTIETPSAGAVNPVRYQPKPGDCKAVAGDLVITEIQANPDGADAGKEWIEFYNASGAILDLRGLVIEIGEGSIAIGGPDPILAPFDGYFIMASSDKLVSTWDWHGALADLSNSGGVVSVRCLGGAELDSACWGDGCVPVLGAAGDGKSFAWAGAGTPTVDANDDPLTWAISEPPTPAEANPVKEPTLFLEEPTDCVTTVAAHEATLTITEIYANAAGADDGKEWIEVLVESDSADCISLDGVRITSNIETSSGGYMLGEGAGASLFKTGTYAVFAGSEAALNGAAIAGWLDTSLPNSNGTVALWGDSGTPLAVAEYGSAKEAAATQWFDGAWCLATAPLVVETNETDGIKGTPGAENPPCDACFCIDGDAVVQAASPSAGELMITEVMADVPGSETDGANYEWVEVTLLPSVSEKRSLACSALGKTAEGSTKPVTPAGLSGCLWIDPGAAMTIGRSSAPSINGGFETQALYDGLSLSANGTVAVFSGATVIDVATYGQSSDGVARKLDPSALESGDLTVNDDPAQWCDAVLPYNVDLGAYGTPGQGNPGCNSCVCPTEGGGFEEVDNPAAGDLVITEIFGNTPGSETAGWEWFEVGTVASAPVVLNCLAPVMGGTTGEALRTTNSGCLTLGPGERVVLCADADGAAETGVGPCFAYDAKAMTGSGTVGLAGPDGTVITTVAYEALSDGVSAQFAGAGSGCDMSVYQPDHLWCETPAASVYASIPEPEGEEGAMLTFIGTPGAANPCCL